MFKTEIGDTVVLHGMIALTIFARTCQASKHLRVRLDKFRLNWLPLQM